MKNILSISVLCLCILCSSCVTVRENQTESSGVSSETATSRDVCLEGTVLRIVENAGTLSEIQYFLLVTGDGTRIILFNEKGFSEGFSRWLDKKTTVNGYTGSGKIGYKRLEKPGLFVTSISEAQ